MIERRLPDLAETAGYRVALTLNSRRSFDKMGAAARVAPCLGRNRLTGKSADGGWRKAEDEETVVPALLVDSRFPIPDESTLRFE
jgi:hypothetical protein